MPDSSEAMHRLGYHPVASEAQKRLYEENRYRFIELFMYIESVPGASREKSLALTQLQDALMWLNAHVACNGIYAND